MKKRLNFSWLCLGVGVDVLSAWSVTRSVFLDVLLGLGGGTSLFPTDLATSSVLSEPSWFRVRWRSTLLSELSA